MIDWVVTAADVAPGFVHLDVKGNVIALSGLLVRGSVLHGFHGGEPGVFAPSSRPPSQLSADIGRIDATLVAISPQAPDAWRSHGHEQPPPSLCLPTSEPRWRGNSASPSRSRTNWANLRRVGRGTGVSSARQPAAAALAAAAYVVDRTGRASPSYLDTIPRVGSNRRTSLLRPPRGSAAGSSTCRITHTGRSGRPRHFDSRSPSSVPAAQRVRQHPCHQPTKERYMMIKVYAFSTPNSVRVPIGLEELGIDYELEAVNVRKGEQKLPPYLALNPNGKVPVIVDPDGPGGGPFVLTEFRCDPRVSRREGRAPHPVGCLRARARARADVLSCHGHWSRIRPGGFL